MKKPLLVSVLAAVVLPGFSAAAVTSPISVFVNGDQVSFPVGQPIEWTGHVMVPLRGVFEQLGGNVQWDSAAQMVTITKGDTTIKMTVGEAHALKNEETIVTNVKSILRGGTCYVPLRFLAETIDAKVHWDGASRSVHISTTKTVASPSSQRKPPSL
jgi:hypothetical protein